MGTYLFATQNSKTYYIFATFPDVTRHVYMPAWQRSLDPLQEMPAASLSQLADVLDSIHNDGRLRFQIPKK